MQSFIATDGAQLAYSDHGTGRPLLLLHGLMAHSGFFQSQRSLADDFRLVALDLRGHGRSQVGRDPPTVERVAGDVEELVRSLDLDDAIGIGWSLGAQILWQVLDGPLSPRFAGAVIVDMTPRVANDKDWQLGLPPQTCDDRSAAIATDFAAFAEAAGQAIFAQPAGEPPRDVALWAGSEFARNDPAAIAALWQSLVAQDFRDMLRRIAQPTLIVHGAQSHLYGADTADYLTGAIPRSSAVAFERSGHAPHIEQAELFNQTIRDFAASLPRPAAFDSTVISKE